ncbi:MAG: RHS repeat-associated core domain-containing protein, partial [bacterium]
VSVAGTTVYGFDAGERLQTLATIAANSNQDSFCYTYDPINGQLASVACSNGLSCAYGYDILDRLTGITWVNASNQVLRSRSYNYTAAGMIDRINLEDGGHVEYTYDSLDRLTREKHVDIYGQVASDEKYEFDLAGNRTKKTVLDSAGNPLVTVGYTLGTGNRLSSWTVAETNLMACFPVAGYASETIGANDRFGALWVSNAAPSGMSVKPVLSGTNFLVDQMVVSMGTQTIVAAIRDVAGNTSYVTNTVIPTVVTNGAYQYNTAGCLTNIQYKGKDYSQSLGLTWNGQYQLTAATTNGAVAERYGYDAAGRRLWVWDGTAGTNWFVYDGNQVVADLNSTGGLVRSYVWGTGIDSLLSMTVYGGTTNTYYALKDHLGSVLALTDGAGNIVESYRYDAWGRTTVYAANGNELTTSAIGNRYCWQGREYSWKTGIYYFRARWADPVTGRWLSPDPIGIAGGFNLYAMMGCNAVNFKDPFGLCDSASEAGKAAGKAYAGFWQWIEKAGLIYTMNGKYYHTPPAPENTSGHTYSNPLKALPCVPEQATLVGTWHTHPFLTNPWPSVDDGMAADKFHKRGIDYNIMINGFGGTYEYGFNAKGNYWRGW